MMYFEVALVYFEVTMVYCEVALVYFEVAMDFTSYLMQYQHSSNGGKYCEKPSSKMQNVGLWNVQQ